MPRGKKKVPAEQAQAIHILVVDDESSPRELLRTALSEEGFQIKTAKSGEEACQYIDKKNIDKKKFDLVLTDLKMPGLSGIHLLKKIKERSPETLVILITGFASLRSAIEAIREGAYDYLTKPFQLDELYIVVRNAVERIKLIRENNKLLDELKKFHEDVAEEKGPNQIKTIDPTTSLDLIQALRQQLLKVYSRTD